jgi:hypothetical protein
MKSLVRLSAALSVVLALLLAAPAFAVDAGDIVVASVKGEVRVTMNGAAREVRAGTVLELPAQVRTGRDGAIELRQGATSVNVGPDTDLDFPALEKRGAPVDRIVQPRGNAFYDIGKREGRKLRVETPYLVGVIKGTQFNVSAQPDGTTISLFEGRLEVRTSDGDGVVDLNAGEIATRKRGDASIGVLRMNDKAPATAPRSQGQNGQPAAVPEPALAGAVDLRPRDELVADVVSIHTNDAPSVAVESGSVDVDAGAAVETGTVVDAGTAVEAGVPVDTVAADTGSVVDTGVAVDTGTVVDADVDVGNAGSIDAGVDTSVNVGGGSASVDVGAGVDVSTGGISPGVDAGAVVDVGSGGIDAGATVDVGSNVPGVDAGVNAGVDTGAGTVDVGVSVGGIDVDLGVDLGLDDDDDQGDNSGPGNDDGNNGHGNDRDGHDSNNPGNSGPGNVVDDVGGLLDDLVRRPGRKK